MVDIVGKPPLVHRIARKFATRGIAGASLYWGLVQRIAPYPHAGPVLIEPNFPLIFEPDDWVSLNAYRGLLERNEIRVMEALIHPGDTVVDVGANIGYLSTVAARLVGPSGRVIAIEPSPLCLGSLELLKSLMSNIEVIPVAAGRQVGTSVLEGHDSPGHSGLGSIRNGRNTGGDLVAVRTLDDLLAESGIAEVGFLKIDVEGFEAAVLEGAKRLIGRHAFRAAILEVSPEFGSVAFLGPLVRQLRSHYEFYVVEESGHFLRRPHLKLLDPDQLVIQHKQFNMLVAHKAVSRLIEIFR